MDATSWRKYKVLLSEAADCVALTPQELEWGFDPKLDPQHAGILKPNCAATDSLELGFLAIDVLMAHADSFLSVDGIANILELPEWLRPDLSGRLLEISEEYEFPVWRSVDEEGRYAWRAQRVPESVSEALRGVLAAGLEPLRFSQIFRRVTKEVPDLRVGTALLYLALLQGVSIGSIAVVTSPLRLYRSA
jgi:hypothetical protein